MGITRSVFMDKGSEVPHLGMALGFRLGLQKSVKSLPFLGLFLIPHHASGRPRRSWSKQSCSPLFPAEPEWESVLPSPEGVPVPVPSSCHQSQALCKGTALILVGSGFSHGIRGTVPCVPCVPSAFRVHIISEQI